MPCEFAKTRRPSTDVVGRTGQRVVDIEPNANDVASAGQHVDQDAGQFLSRRKDVVRPVQSGPVARDERLNRLDNRDSDRQRAFGQRVSRQGPVGRVEQQAKRQASPGGPPAVRTAAPPGGLFLGHDQQRQRDDAGVSRELQSPVLCRRQRFVVFHARNETAGGKSLSHKLIVRFGGHG